MKLAHRARVPLCVDQPLRALPTLAQRPLQRLAHLLLMLGGGTHALRGGVRQQDHRCRWSHRGAARRGHEGASRRGGRGGAAGRATAAARFVELALLAARFVKLALALRQVMFALPEGKRALAQLRELGLEPFLHGALPLAALFALSLALLDLCRAQVERRRSSPQLCIHLQRLRFARRQRLLSEPLLALPAPLFRSCRHEFAAKLLFEFRDMCLSLGESQLGSRIHALGGLATLLPFTLVSASLILERL